jgi:hypothetical protein
MTWREKPLIREHRRKTRGCDFIAEFLLQLDG